MVFSNFQNEKVFTFSEETEMSSEIKPRSFNILLFGPGNAGKTTYMNKVTSGQFTNQCGGPLKWKVPLKTNCGTVEFTVTESCICSFNEEERYDGYLFMFSLEEKLHELDFLIEIKNPVIILGNKYDSRRSECNLSDWAVRNTMSRFSFFQVSAKSGYQVGKPFLSLLEELIEEDVHIIT